MSGTFFVVGVPPWRIISPRKGVEGNIELLFDRKKSPYRQIFWNMAWSPDGKRIVFSCHKRVPQD